MRSVPRRERDDFSRRTYLAGDQESPYRAHAVLSNVARGHALAHGRERVTADDIPLIGRVTLSSMPNDVGRLFRTLARTQAGALTVAEVQKLLGARHPDTARDRMRCADALGVMEFDEGGTGKTARLRFRAEWEWCSSSEFAEIAGGFTPPVTMAGL